MDLTDKLLIDLKAKKIINSDMESHVICLLIDEIFKLKNELNRVEK
ncbi:hypothetical protein [Niallia sp. FSL M8-0099]